MTGQDRGQLDGYELLEHTGELGTVSMVCHLEAGTASSSAVDRVLGALRGKSPDVVVLWTPGRFPTRRSDFDRMLEAMGSAPLLYWEGDPWARAKPITKQMRWWMSASHIVFSTAGPPQATAYLKAGAREVRHIANTYCHLRFAACEAEEPPPVDSKAVLVIGSNMMRIPGVTGLPGSLRRWELVTRLRRADVDLQLYGRGWGRVGYSAEFLPYADQAKVIRSGALSVNYDHWPYLPDYSSDRLPIALIAGRPHVTVRHPGMTWGPLEEQGLFQCESPKEIVETALELLPDRESLSRLGREAHRWAAHRVSHREAARYILSTVVDGVRPPPSDPWSDLPGPWIRPK